MKQALITLWNKVGTRLTLKDTARRLCYAPRTVQKQLQNEGTNFRKFRIEYRRDQIFKADKAYSDLPVALGTVLSPAKTRGRLQGTRYVFTSVQNNTYIHENLFSSLLQYCGFNDAQLVIGRFSYNKKGYQRTKGDEKLWYDDRIKEYVLDESTELTSNAIAPCKSGIIWCGELDILPTAAKPTTGFNSYTQNNSAIIPHAKMQMQPCAVGFGEEPKFLYTTGALTQRNYIDRAIGQKASFHHVFGALVVEIDEDGDWFARQLVANEAGEFHDLDYKYMPHGREKSNIIAVNWGDLHAEKVDPDTAKGSWGEGDSILNVLRPEYQFVHDSTDFQARNHHNLKSPYFLAEMLHAGTDSVEAGMAATARVLTDMWRPWTQTVIVASNHDEAFKRWLLEADTRFDPVNVRYWHQMNYMVHKTIEDGHPNLDPYAYWMKKIGVKATFLQADQSFKLLDVEHGMHGHIGINGSRGSVQQFRNLNTKVTLGHGHSATIIDGVSMAGLSGLMAQGYNRGPGTWSASHVFLYDTGKRATVTMRGSKWRAKTPTQKIELG